MKTISEEKGLLLQEVYREDPWKMLVCCMLLNCTSRRQVDVVRGELFEKWPTPEKMASADAEELKDVIRSLGFGNRRSSTLKKMSSAYMSGSEVDSLPGIGEYALDSWRIFQEGRTDLRPRDKVLKAFLEKKEQNPR